MSGGNGRQSSSEVAHEAEDTRAHLASTLEQLRTNLQPANVVDEVVSNARIGVASVADNLVGVAKQYPIPSALVAAGSALIMRFFSKRDDEGEARAGGIRAASPDTRSAAADVGQARDAVVDGLSSGAAALRRHTAEAYSATAAQAGEAVQSVSRYMPASRGDVKSKLATLFEEQPLVLGAIGLAIGAAIGAALPTTETEDSLMGSAAHRLRGSATDAARTEVDGIRAAAGEAMDNVRHSAEDNFKAVVDKAGDALSGSRDV